MEDEIGKDKDNHVKYVGETAASDEVAERLKQDEDVKIFPRYGKWQETRQKLALNVGGGTSTSKADSIFIIWALRDVPSAATTTGLFSLKRWSGSWSQSLDPRLSTQLLEGSTSLGTLPFSNKPPSPSAITSRPIREPQ
ncbi:hypothetical protein CF327_g7272 [Tilletia walkeri]|uniref:Uncharacterized protein n=1 Tax=Tilletia walkeri TaxID=117179 RepID=A0A8X7N442_9BASI|nr:hypothetical protein CF327_g7272 [Tilletia walkeri]KAE8264446.1 hypothetical protein A4X09_0g6962 [Tilletia walkeri]